MYTLYQGVKENQLKDLDWQSLITHTLAFN